MARLWVVVVVGRLVWLLFRCRCRFWFWVFVYFVSVLADGVDGDGTRDAER